MKRLFKLTTAVAIAVATFASVWTQGQCLGQEIIITVKHKDDQPDVKKPFHGTRASVDVAILLDTSNSMDGLINQAKSQLWNIVDEFANAEKNGQTPSLRVAVFEYGNSRLPAREGFIRQVVGLTDDLDKVSEALFGLSTSGGDEYCGTVIEESLKRLDWSSEPNAFKAIFIAGNEPFTQGSVDYQRACKKAIQSGVVVNTIHCGDYQQGITGKWKHGAEIAEGEYLNINQDRKVIHIKCPQDAIILELNTELNKTYLWYGAKSSRDSYRENQLAQDDNAKDVGGFGGRAQTKLGKLYSNSGRDLVDGLEENESLLKGVKEAELPEALRNLNEAERKQYVQKMAAKREEVKKKMADVNKERLAYIEAEKAKLAEAGSAAPDTLGDAISTAVSSQLEKAGFEMKGNK